MPLTPPYRGAGAWCPVLRPSRFALRSLVSDASVCTGGLSASGCQVCEGKRPPLAAWGSAWVPAGTTGRGLPHSPPLQALSSTRTGSLPVSSQRAGRWRWSAQAGGETGTRVPSGVDTTPGGRPPGEDLRAAIQRGEGGLLPRGPHAPPQLVLQEPGSPVWALLVGGVRPPGVQGRRSEHWLCHLERMGLSTSARFAWGLLEDAVSLCDLRVSASQGLGPRTPDPPACFFSVWEVSVSAPLLHHVPPGRVQTAASRCRRSSAASWGSLKDPCI